MTFFSKTLVSLMIKVSPSSDHEQILGSQVSTMAHVSVVGSKRRGKKRGQERERDEDMTVLVLFQSQTSKSKATIIVHPSKRDIQSREEEYVEVYVAPGTNSQVAKDGRDSLHHHDTYFAKRRECLGFDP